MTNRYEDVNYRLARRDNVRARAQREAWDAVSFLVDVVAGRVPIPDEGDGGDEGDEGDEGDALEGAFSALERFVELERNPEPLSAAVLTLIDSGTRPRVADTPS